MGSQDPYALQRVLDYLSNPQIIVYGGSEEKVENPFGLTPRDFLGFAKIDLDSNLDHCNINALSNLKRALDCRIEEVLWLIGFLEVAKRERWGLPKKLETIQQLGVAAPTVLNRINSKRNLLEHEFEAPDINEVIDAFDVVELFVSYTDILFDRFPGHVDLCLGFENEIIALSPVEMALHRNLGQLAVTGWLDADPTSFTVSRDEPSYLTFLRHFLQYGIFRPNL